MQNSLLERLRGHLLSSVNLGFPVSEIYNLVPDIISALEERDRLREAVEEYKAMDVTLEMVRPEAKPLSEAGVIVMTANTHWRTQRDAITKKFNL